MIEERKYSVLLKQEEAVRLFGKDVLLNLVDKDYGVLYGVIKRNKADNIKQAKKLINRMDIEAVETSSTSLYYFLRNQANYPGYLLREYRAGAALLQSYFKDHTPLMAHRLILKRLATDWRDNLKPYSAALKSRTINANIFIESEGFITMDRNLETAALIDRLINMKILDHKKALERVRAVRIFTKEELKTPISLHRNLAVQLNEKYKEKWVGKFKTASERLVDYLNESAGVYGLNREKEVTSFNLVYSKSVEDMKSTITTALSIDISPENIIISPNTGPDYFDLLHLYYGIDRYFDFAVN